MGKPQSKLDESSLPFATIPELSQALRQHQITSSELAKFFGKRLETIGPSLNALACSTMKRAKDDWGDVDYEFKRERFRGPLQGIPYGVKDLIAVAGYPTTWGAKPYANQTFDKDAAVVDRLDGADAILIGKLSMIELAGGGGYSSASASLQGPGLNPWNLQYWAGGSSSGSGAAVAAGLVPLPPWSATSGAVLCSPGFFGGTGVGPAHGFVSPHGALARSR